MESVVDKLLDWGINPLYFFTAITVANAIYLVLTNTPERKRQRWQQHYVWSAVVTAAAMAFLSVLSLAGVVNL